MKTIQDGHGQRGQAAENDRAHKEPPERRLMLRHLGEQNYGVWVLIGSAFAYSGVLGLGLSSAINRYIPVSLARGTEDDIRRVTSTGTARSSHSRDPNLRIADKVRRANRDRRSNTTKEPRVSLSRPTLSKAHQTGTRTSHTPARCQRTPLSNNPDRISKPARSSRDPRRSLNPEHNRQARRISRGRIGVIY